MEKFYHCGKIFEEIDKEILMTVCFFGNYIEAYPRIEVMRKGLMKNGVAVIECHTRKRGAAKYFDLYRKHRELKGRYDVMLVCMGGQTLVWFAKILCGKKIVFDAFASLYLTNVEDRKIAKAGSLRAMYYAFWDKFPCQSADVVLLDTGAQIQYFRAKYNLAREKFARVFVGADDQTFFPEKVLEKSGKFVVHWHGHIVPFHGLEIVIKAAEILQTKAPDITFEIITRFNSKYERIKSYTDIHKITNIKFIPEMDYKELAKAINRADITLGIFGNNGKAEVVIPNKIYESLACAKPVITARFGVLGELLTDEKNVILSNPADSEDLAKKILWCKDHPAETASIAQAGFETYREHLTPEILGQELKRILF
ncbi:glycosyltransferase [bacterium]|nr:MAG: glycosyltransferase [bacterium]